MQAVIILVELLWLAAAALAYRFVCQICGKRCFNLQAAGYAALFGAVNWAQSLGQWPAVVVTLAQALLLALCARLLAGCAPQQALAAALLATAIWLSLIHISQPRPAAISPRARNCGTMRRRWPSSIGRWRGRMPGTCP